MILHPAQSQIVKDNHRFRVVNCGRRFGKTTLAVVEMVGKAVSKKDQIVSYIAPTFQQARDISWNLLRKIAEPITLKVNESRLELTVQSKDGGSSLISLRGWESIETMRGMRNDLLIPDEISSYRNFQSNWQEILRPTLTDTKGQALFLSTPKGFNHFYDLYNKERDDQDYKSFHFTTYDNPFIPVEEINKAKQELTEDRFAQEYLADFRKTEGLVYKEFSREKHLYDTYSGRTVERIAGIDFGFTNPCAILTIIRDADETLWVEEEYYKTGKTDSEIAEYVAAGKFNKVYPDPESPGAIKELTKLKVPVREVIKGKDSIKNGIAKVTELFKTNKLFINKRCENLIYELETYSYPDKKDLHNPDENPIKENDHACDALRYPILMLSAYQQRAKQFVPSNMDRTAIPSLHREPPKMAQQFIPNQFRPR